MKSHMVHAKKNIWNEDVRYKLIVTLVPLNIMYCKTNKMFEVVITFDTLNFLMDVLKMCHV